MDSTETAYNIAGIDVHKKMLAVVIASAKDTELRIGAARPRPDDSVTA